MQIVEQLCGEYEREVLQMTQAGMCSFRHAHGLGNAGPGMVFTQCMPQDIVRYRGELARCADLLAYQLGKEI